MIPPCPRCSGQLIGGSCLQCSFEPEPDFSGPSFVTSSFDRFITGTERHSRPLPLAETRAPWTMAANPRKVRR